MKSDVANSLLTTQSIACAIFLSKISASQKLIITGACAPVCPK